MRASLLLQSASVPILCSPSPHTSTHLKTRPLSAFLHTLTRCPITVPPSRTVPTSRRRRNDFRVRSDEGDAEDYDAYEEEESDIQDYDVEYEMLTKGGGSEEIAMVESKSFVSTQGSDAEVIVDYRINEEEFHKFSLLHCDFFIRRPPDPDGDVYDFREMYVTPPDTDVYAIPKVLAPMPENYIRCAKSDYGCYNVTQPPIDSPRDPLYKSEREIYKVFLTKHYRNRRLKDPDFVLDFEEIYVIDSKTKSITRAKVMVTIPEARSRDRRNDVLIIREGGNSFKIIDKSRREDPSTVLQREEWIQSRQKMETYLRKLRDFNVSNWF